MGKSNAYLLLPRAGDVLTGGFRVSGVSSGCAFYTEQLILLGFRRASGLMSKSNAEFAPPCRRCRRGLKRVGRNVRKIFLKGSVLKGFRFCTMGKFSQEVLW